MKGARSQFKKQKRILILPIIFVGLNCLFSFGQSPRNYPWQYFWQKSLTSYKNKDYAAFLEDSKRAVDSGPAAHPTLFYNLARAYSLTGNKTKAVEWLEKTLDLGFGTDSLAGADFIFLRESPEYSAIRKRIEELGKPRLASEVALTVDEPDLIPESLAYDRAGRSFYVGSFYKRKIVRIDRRGKKTDFIAEGADGLGAVVGIKIDAAQRILLVLSNGSPEMKNFEMERRGFGMLHKYDLQTGRLIKKYELPNKPRPHLLNDLVISKTGDLFITDSLSSTIHLLRNGGRDEIEVFAELAPYSYPNGIALSRDESKLYVANLNGIAVIETGTGQSAPLVAAENIALSGVDGLYFYENRLLAIQNFESPNRVVRFELNESGDRVTRAEVLEANHPHFKTPTTGAISGRNFYYIANSQLRSFDENGKIPAAEKLAGVRILRLKL